MAFPKMFLLRHGQTHWNGASRLQGHLDSSLTAIGEAQARAQGVLLARIFKEEPDISVLSSPQGRAQKTAEIALKSSGRVARTEPRLREISAGVWDGAFLSDIERTHGHLFEQARNAFELMFLAPDGEGEVAVLKRCEALLSEQDKPVVFVTHGATLCVLRGLLRAQTFETMLDLTHEQGCIYKIENGVETILR